MSAHGRGGRRGFSMVELMVVVVIIGVLAGLAIYGIRRYLASAKTAEAKQSVGAIARGLVTAWEAQKQTNAMLGDTGVEATIAFPYCPECPAAVVCGPVPAAVPQGTKYQPSTAAAADFNVCCWRCVRFDVTQPIYYQYSYRLDSNYEAPGMGGPDPGPSGFEAIAKGDLDGDGAESAFIASGRVNPATREVTRTTTIFIHNEFE